MATWRPRIGAARIIARCQTYNAFMKQSELDEGLRILREATEQAAQIRIEMTDDYLALIARIEALAENQPGANKVDHWEGTRRYLDFFRRAVQVSRRS